MKHHLTKNVRLDGFFALCLCLALLTGCATPGTRPEGTSAASLLKQAEAARTPRARLGLLAAAADSAAQAYRRSGADADRLTYNQASAEFATVWKSSGLSLPLALQSPKGTYQIRSGSTRSSGAWNPDRLTEILPTSAMPNQKLVAKTPPDGFGGVVVGVDRPANPRAKLYPKRGVSVPVTAVLNFEPSSPGTTTAILTLYNPANRKTAAVAGRTRSLAADLSAPFGYYPLAGKKGFLGMLRPGKYEETEGLYLIQPYDPAKIPLVFIHGLMSSPQMWLPVMAQLEADPELRGKFQFWAFAYPTGDPIAYLALQLREALAQMYKVYPDMKDMMIINHSLGGVITHLQVIDTGDALVNAVFKDKAPKILALPDSSLLKRALIFEANPRIKEIVYIAAPHLGAPLASGFIGRLGASLVKIPTTLVKEVGEKTLGEAMAIAGLKKNEIPNVIYGLDPHQPLLVAMCKQKVKAPCHSIIGVAGRPTSPLEKTSDTVVPYWSSHLDYALSEKIVHATHETICAHPESVAEMKRIAKLYLRGKRFAR